MALDSDRACCTSCCFPSRRTRSPPHPRARLCFECAYFDWTASSDAVCPWDLPLAPWFRGVIFSHTGDVTVLLHLFGLPILTRFKSLGAKLPASIHLVLRPPYIAKVNLNCEGRACDFSDDPCCPGIPTGTCTTAYVDQLRKTRVVRKLVPVNPTYAVVPTKLAANNSSCSQTNCEQLELFAVGVILDLGLLASSTRSRSRSNS